MKNKRRVVVTFLAGVLLVTLMKGPSMIYAVDDRYSDRIPQGVYIEMTREFYDALKGNGYGGTKVYSNDPSKQYLKEIAISARFMVETNLQILKQQEKMTRLLHSLLAKKK